MPHFIIHRPPTLSHILSRTEADDTSDDGMCRGDVPAVIARYSQPDGTHKKSGGHTIRCKMEMKLYINQSIHKEIRHKDIDIINE